MINYRRLTLGCFVTGVVLNVAVVAQLREESSRPLGLEMFSVGQDAEQLTFRQSADDSSSGNQPLRELRRRGLQVFATPFTKADGFGDGVFNSKEVPSSLPGHRPTLQGNGTMLRVNGLDAQSCNECHTIVSNATVPPTLGIGGVGGIVQNALILPTVIDVADSADDRVAGLAPQGGTMMADGIAEFNGRMANPPFLFGGGGVELLGKEMTLDLQFLLQRAREAPVGTVTSLDTHGVNFGVLTTQAAGEVDLSRVVGIGFQDNVGRRPEDVLVVRPFGRKGENFSMRDFDRGAMQFHFGIQPVEVVGDGVDLDGDGVVNEISVESMTALHVFDVTNPRPFMEPLDSVSQTGFALFRQIGCARCHRPQLETRSRFLPLAHPEVAEDPMANVHAAIDLVEVGFSPSPNGGVFVPLFADLKRHAMGEVLMENFHDDAIANDEFTTARLWGIADTGPYLHDGRALSLSEAIAAHGGEAEMARDAFLSLTQLGQETLVAFLNTLRTPIAPNVELVVGP